MSETVNLAPQVYSPSEEEAKVLRDIALPLNHCSVPSWLLASLAYQQQPIPVEIDGVSTWYSAVFTSLSKGETAEIRADRFKEFMTHRFNLSKARYQSEAMAADPPPRPKVNYRRLLLGWLLRLAHFNRRL